MTSPPDWVRVEPRLGGMMERWFRLTGEQCEYEVFFNEGIEGFAEAEATVNAGDAARAIALADGQVFDLLSADRRDHYSELAEAAMRAIGGEPV